MYITKLDSSSTRYLRKVHRLLSVLLASAACALLPADATAETENATRGLIVSPGQSIQIFLTEDFESEVPSTVSFYDSGGNFGIMTIAQTQIDAHAGTIDIDPGQIDSFIYTAPLSEGVDQIVIADLYGRIADPSREMGINVFVVNEANPETSIFGTLGTHPNQLWVEPIGLQSVDIPSIGSTTGYQLEVPYSFDGLEAYTLASDGAVRNLVLYDFVVPLASGGDRRGYQAQRKDPDCSRMLPGETLTDYVKRCFKSGPTPPTIGQIEIDVGAPKPIKAPVSIGPLPIGTGSNGGHIEGSGTAKWDPSSVTGGPGGTATVGGGTNWNTTCIAHVFYDKQEKSWTRITRRWNGRKWVVIKSEICTQTFLWTMIKCPPNPVRVEGPEPIAEPVCREVKR